MFGVSLPVTRPAGRALLIVHESSRSGPLETLSQQGFQCAAREDPYSAMAELARRPLAYRAVVLSLQSLYGEELNLIPAIKRRWPYLDIWLTHIDGRASALAEAMRLGADGLLAEDGQLHRTAASTSGSGGSSIESFGPLPPLRAVTSDEAPPAAGDDGPAEAATAEQSQEAGASEPYVDEATGEPVLSADELRALLQEPPAALPSGNGGNVNEGQAS